MVTEFGNGRQYEDELLAQRMFGNLEAEKFAMSSVEPERPTLAIVMVNHLDIEGGNVDYKIRMNFTTVPSTWHSLHNKQKGLLIHYKHYYTSGFLNLQEPSRESNSQKSTSTSKLLCCPIYFQPLTKFGPSCLTQ